MKRIPQIGVFILAFFLLFSVSVCARDDGVYHWYCRRNKEHKQPLLAGEFSFIEQYNGYHVDKKHGDNDPEKVVYFTFDAGYENGNVGKTLDILKQENVPGAFFVLGNLVTSNPDLINRMLKEGHTVCNHTYSHKNVTKFTKEQFGEELNKLEDAYTQCTGELLSKYYRPPEGKFSFDNIKYANELGYKTVFWSFAYEDWDNNKQMDPVAAKEKILSNIHNGAVILLHPTSSTNTVILGDVIRNLKAQGYRFGTLDELTAY